MYICNIPHRRRARLRCIDAVASEVLRVPRRQHMYPDAADLQRSAYVRVEPIPDDENVADEPGKSLLAQLGERLTRGFATRLSYVCQKPLFLCA